MTNTLDNYKVKNCFGINCLLTIEPYGSINNCLPSDLINDQNESPTTELSEFSFKNGVCSYFSNECLCFFWTVGY